MSEKIVLIDGHSILNRAFYGVPDLTNSDGLHTNAIHGFLNIMFKILEEESPDYLTVAFDVHAPTFRHEMYEAYKGTRKPMLEELRQQVPVMKDVLKSMGICVVECAGLEADDLLGTLSKMAREKGMEVSVISGDRDLLQLATETVKIRIPKTKQNRTEVENYLWDDVIEKYQVTPIEFIDLKALMGDSSDNIPGVPSIGEKTATKIITQFHSIENAYAHIDEIKPPRAQKALQEHWDLAVMSKKLATICLDAKFPYDFEKARLGDIYTQEAYVLFQKLQLNFHLKRFSVMAPSNRIEDEFRQIKKKEDAVQFLNKMAKEACIGVALFKDEEKQLPLFAKDAMIDGVAICSGEKEIGCILTNHDIEAPWLLEEVSKIINRVDQFAMFDIKSQMKDLTIVREEGAFDGMVAGYLLNPLNNAYSYKDMLHEQVGISVDDKLEQSVKACYEAYAARIGCDILKEKLQEAGMLSLFLEVEMPLVFTLREMEKNGVKVKREELQSYSQKLGEKIQILEEDIYELASERFNINSPKQLGVILFEKMGITGGRKTKSGYSTAADVLEKLAPDHPVIAKVLEYRQLAKLKSTYADGLTNFILEDGRIHGTFNQTITATGRISSTEPNLQNIPIRMELGRLIRKVFVPEDGYVFVDADYSQIELRVLAHCSGDESLIKAYQEEADIHRITASKVFRVPFDEVTELQRRNAKAVNFGIVYGISSFGLSQDLSISRKEAAQYIEDYFETYPGIKGFLDDAVATAKELGFSTTLLGRRRPIPELSSSNFMQRSFGERVAMNAPIQGAAADIMKIAMVGVLRKLKENHMKSKLVLQVHDELLIEAWEPELEQVKAILRQEMEHAMELKVPLAVDMHTGKNWYEAK